MPTITLNKTVLEELTGKQLPLDELKDRISMLGTDLEGIEGDEVTVEIFPNRPDLLSEQGFARAFSAFIGVKGKTGLREYKVEKSGEKVIVDKNVTMRPYTACAVVKGLQFTDEKIRELMQIQEKLATTHGRNRKKSAYGIYPLQSINFPVKYIAKDPKEVTFKPLGFAQEISADKIEEEHPKGKAYKDVAQGWTKYPFFIDAKDNVMCMLPYTNSEDTGKVELDTTEVFIECTGISLENVQVALTILTTTLADMGGKVYSVDVEYADKTITTPNFTPQRMKLDVKYSNKYLGLDLDQPKMVELLQKMGFGFDKTTNEVLIPAWRDDIQHQIDLTEDIAIAHGYENFEETIPNVATIGQEAPLEKFTQKIRQILIGYGLLEAKNFHLTTEQHVNGNMKAEKQIVKLQNALGEHNVLRNIVMPSLIANLAENQHYEYPQNMFEVGRTFEYGDDETSETGIIEKEHLAVVVCHDKADFTSVKQILDGIAVSLGIEYEMQEVDHASYITGRVAKIMLNGKRLGTLGELHPKVLENWQLDMPAAVFELDVEELFRFVESK